jgi:uncharacterized protein (TIGR03435 family)
VHRHSAIMEIAWARFILAPEEVRSTLMSYDFCRATPFATVALTAAIAVSAPVFLSLMPPGLRAEPQATTEIAFEVASVRPAPPNNRMQFSFPPGGRFIAKSATLKTLVVLAYDVREFQISGGPSWINSDRYDIVSKSEIPSPTRDQMGIMLRTLLKERFKLAVRQEVREMPVYALVVAKSGLKLQESSDDKTVSLDGGPGRAVGTKVSMSLFSRFLSQQVIRGVVDRTGLTANYDVKLSWSPDVNQSQTSPDAGPSAEFQGPSLFTALHEQMGLRLESQRGPVDFIVISSVEKPTAN